MGQVGRPSLYFERVQPYLNNIKEWVLDGCSNMEIAARLEVPVGVFCDYQNKFPEFKEALRGHWKEANKKIVEALKTRAIGYEIQDSKEIEEEYWAIDKITKLPYRVLDDNGNPVIIKRTEKINKHIPSDTKAATFLLMNRDKENWQYMGGANTNIAINNTNNNALAVQNNFNLQELSDDDLLNELKKLEG